MLETFETTGKHEDINKETKEVCCRKVKLNKYLLNRMLFFTVVSKLSFEMMFYPQQDN